MGSTDGKRRGRRKRQLNIRLGLEVHGTSYQQWEWWCKSTATAITVNALSRKVGRPALAANCNGFLGQEQKTVQQRWGIPSQGLRLFCLFVREGIFVFA